MKSNFALTGTGWLIHPICLYAYPSLFLYSQNTNFFELSTVLRPLLVMLVVGALSIVFIFLLCKERERSALLASSLILAFYFTNPILEAMYDFASSSLASANILNEWSRDITKHIPGGRRHLHLLSILGIQGGLYLAVTIWLVKSKVSTRSLTLITNVFSVVLLAFPVASIVSKDISIVESNTREVQRVPARSAQNTDLPNIFLLLLDGYSRQDSLMKHFSFDNQPFIDKLREREFYVAEGSRANYFATYMAITALLNMNYIENILTEAELKENRFPTLDRYRDNSTVVETLRQYGYSFYTFQSEPRALTVGNSDLLIAPPGRALDLNIFETQILNATSLGPVTVKVLEKLGFDYRFDLHREWILEILSRLPNLADTAEQRFVFAHIPAPHPPFVFQSDGHALNLSDHFSIFDGSHHFTTPDLLAEYRDNYPLQLSYLNTIVEQSIDGIIRRSIRPVIIIIMSDHGSRALTDWSDPELTCFEEARSSFFAARLPHHRSGSEIFHESISPVNVFRAVFNEYFGTEYERLPDRTLYSKWKQPFEFRDVTSRASEIGCSRWPTRDATLGN